MNINPKSALLSLKKARNGDLKLRFTFPENAATPNGEQLKTPEFKVAATYPSNEISDFPNLIALEIKTLEQLKEAAERRLKTLSTLSI